MARLPNTLLLGRAVFIDDGSDSHSDWSAIGRSSDILLWIIPLPWGAFIGISMPSFWLALLLIELFANRLGILPSVGMTSLSGELTGMAKILDIGKHVLLPAVVLSFTSIAYWSRYQRATLLEILNQDFIRTARAKGLSEKLVTWRHAFRNSLIPVVTLAGLTLPDIVNGGLYHRIGVWLARDGPPGNYCDYRSRLPRW